MRATTTAAADRSASTPQSAGAATPPLDLDQIQGDIGDFNKDRQTFVFPRFPKGRQD